MGKKRKLLPNGAGSRCEEDLYMGYIDIRYTKKLIVVWLHADPIFYEFGILISLFILIKAGYDGIASCSLA